MNDPDSAIHIKINGETRAVCAGMSLLDLVADLGLPPQTALVEHNGQALLRSDWPRRTLADGDQLEILRVVAGG